MFEDPPEVVVTVCDRAAESCPTLLGARVLGWSFSDPALATGTAQEVRSAFREVRDTIRARIEAFLEEESAVKAEG